jgi:receptor tyrosine kinase-like orphan receptor 1
MKWAKVPKGLTHIELAGNSYCRNVDHSQRQPWCYVDRQTIELCDIPKCADKMWFIIICALALFLLFTFLFTLLVCCKKMRKQGVSNIQNVSCDDELKSVKFY